ncbi:MAG: hypothetical protein PHD82_04900 [Candidatus Riflebacteria bacterium]|jgi:hypothetical protein|nr:hypothetical protein [Candidatus Riflebacteria bacterium]
MKRFFRIRLIIMLLALTAVIPMTASALMIKNPDEIKVDGLVSFGEDGAAWLSWNGHEMLVTAGYMIGTDLRVVAVRHDSVVLYRSEAKHYHVLVPEVSLPGKDRSDIIWTLPMQIWKLTRLVALAHRKDYICHYSTGSQNAVRQHTRSLEGMMEHVVTPHHRFYPRRGLIFVAPVHVHGTGWKHLMERIQKYRSRTLADWFPVLNEKGTIISDGKPLDQALQKIAFSTGVAIKWQKPVIMPLFCSLRDRPWHEILAATILFNGLEIIPGREGLEIR